MCDYKSYPSLEIEHTPSLEIEHNDNSMKSFINHRTTLPFKYAHLRYITI